MNHSRKLLGVAALILVGASTASADFTLDTVVADGMFNNRPSIEIDADGVMHVAYMSQFSTDDDSKEIYYATNAGGEWSHIQVTDNNVREEFPSLTLDQHGNVHIAFHTGIPGGNKIRYVNNVGADAGEFNEIIDITGEWYVIPEIRVDHDDVVHFTFRTQTIGIPGEDVYYTTWSATDGVGPLVNLSNTPGASAESSQLAIGPDGVVHLVYQDGSAFGGPLVYMTNASGSFQTQPTSVTGGVQDPMILVSDDNVVSILYRQSNSLWVTDDEGKGTFNTPVQTFTDTALPAFYERFAVDSNGNRHIAFASNSQTLRGILYVGETAEGWSAPVQVAGGDSGNQGTSIAVNADGELVVAYALSGFDQQVFADLFVATSTIDVQPCTGDLNGDGVVNVADMLILLGAWGDCPQPCEADLNGDGVVNVADLLILLSEWGDC